MTLGEGTGSRTASSAASSARSPRCRACDIHLEEADADARARARSSPKRLRERIERRVGGGSPREVVGERPAPRRSSSGTHAAAVPLVPLLLPAETALSEAHEATDRLERALRDAVPELHRVSVHAEPE
jgi:hypothetical protein